LTAPRSDVARALSISYEGFCPRGGWAEDFREPPGLLARYPRLRETPLADPAQRTEWNVRAANAVLVLTSVRRRDRRTRRWHAGLRSESANR
jgi:hypothetical protein